MFIALLSVHSQSLNDITGNKLVLKDSVFSSHIDYSLNNKSAIKKVTSKGDYVTFSSGIFVSTNYRSDDNNVPYTSLDLNISLGSIIYLDLGAYGIFFSRESFFAGHGTLGAEFDIVPDKLFTYAGVGAIIIVPFFFTEFAILRINYKFTKDISAGLDNKFISFGKSENLAYRYVVGLNFSYRFNY
jgi:hypothetical protein